MTGEIIVHGVGKSYTQWRSEWQRFARWFGANPRPEVEHWVLRDVSFNVARGEAVGIIGQNGAGKSTLLKLITGTARPTEGTITLTGRVAAILELGMGFNPELSGRENVRHAAGLLGYTQKETERILPEVERFAEIGDYFDEPVRSYSSGMQVRVAFSIATATRPDVLIVDEALSVGDAYFVHKCFQRIREFRAAGTTLLFVSHDPTAVQALCDRAVLLVAGRKLLDGDPREVFDYYNALIAEKENSKLLTEKTEGGAVKTESGTGEAVVESVVLLDRTGAPVEYIGVGEPVELEVQVRVNEPVERLVFGYMIRDRLGQPVFGTNTHHTGQVCEMLDRGTLLRFRASFDMTLGAGSYSVSVALSSTETHLVKNYHWRDLALVFQVANVGLDVFIGTAWLPPRISVERPEVAGIELGAGT
ncbi:MAG TPA: ABC transporter ATP-binding protein [Stenotrophomonas sp.]